MMVSMGTIELMAMVVNIRRHTRLMMRVIVTIVMMAMAATVAMAVMMAMVAMMIMMVAK